MADILGNATTTATLETTTDGGTGTYSGQLETEGDHDWIRVNLGAGNTYNIFLSDLQVGGGSDSKLILRDANGVEVGSNDDVAGSDFNSFLAFTPTTTGTFFIDVSDSSGERGAYSVLLTDLNATNVFLDSTPNTVTANLDERIAGAAGDDIIQIGAGGFGDALGEQGDDTLFGNDLSNILSGGLGNDFLSGNAGNDFLFGDAGDDLLDGGADNDQMFGGDGLDDLFGNAGNDRLSGGADDDILSGDAGSDRLIGGLGRDLLTGGADKDIFDFNSIKESVKGSNRDQILDFNHAVDHDQIDVSGIDANTRMQGDQAFHFIGSHHFDRHAAELRYSNHILQGDVNGDGRVDFEIQINADHLVKGDFVL
jgi:Ca2+-binding RTX toxin-like protein